MGKQAKKVTADTTVEAVEMQGETHTTKQAVIQLVPGAKVNLRGARALWYAKLFEFAGKPASEYLTACAANAPSVPKSGKAEPPKGWLRWFVANGYVTIE